MEVVVLEFAGERPGQPVLLTVCLIGVPMIK